MVKPQSRVADVDVGTVPSAAFEIWLQQGLHQMFDDVSKEPIPEELLRLIEADRRKP